MIISKLKSLQEEEEPSFKSAFSLLVHKSQIGDLMKVEWKPIPPFLKRIKHLEGEWSLFLIHNEESVGDNRFCIIKVLIPAKKAVTETQFLKYREVWPSVFHKKKEEDIPNYVEKYINILKYEDSSCICSGECLIVNHPTLLSTSYDTDNILGHAVFKGVDSVSRSQVGYLCTGFDAFLKREPCLSCAMALVHGRIKRIFIMQKREGGCFSEGRFNYNREINHRYDVYFIE